MCGESTALHLPPCASGFTAGESLIPSVNTSSDISFVYLFENMRISPNMFHWSTALVKNDQNILEVNRKARGSSLPPQRWWIKRTLQPHPSLNSVYIKYANNIYASNLIYVWIVKLSLTVSTDWVALSSLVSPLIIYLHCMIFYTKQTIHFLKAFIIWWWQWPRRRLTKRTNIRSEIFKGWISLGWIFFGGEYFSGVNIF